ncbi:hypothetical protein [Candidatus Thiosymbion oneisti]|uniref:hypothetical protein n=1 Tax=Candidatus Thiosymbion oneisti TaxID=589554 RepID=UPI000B7F8A2B|nr:hypothetical protein [Candidatus Thiosymbion oneisti]
MTEQENPNRPESTITNWLYKWRLPITALVTALGLISAVWVGIRAGDINSFGIVITYVLLLAVLTWLLLEPVEDQDDIVDQETAYGQRVKGILGILVMTVVFSISLVAFSSAHGGGKADEKPDSCTNTKQKDNTDQMIECKTSIKARSCSNNADSGEKHIER